MKSLYTNLLTLDHKCGIYLIKINNKYYVGSSLQLYKRLMDHRNKMVKNKHENKFIQRTFNKYGKQSTYYSILEFCSETKRLIKEKYWIDKLNPCLNLKPCPITQQNCVTTSKIVYQYSLLGVLLNEYKSVSEAQRLLDLTGISAVANKKITKAKSIGGFLWSYEKLDYLSYTNNSSKTRIKALSMYSKEGVKIKRFKSLADAARFIIETGDNYSSLCSCISGVASNDNRGILVKDKYRFSYNDLIKLPKLILKKNFPINQYDLKGDLIKEWTSTRQAADTLNIGACSIRNVIRGKQDHYKEFIWKLKM